MGNKLGKNSVDLLSMNRSIVLNIIRKYENISRIEISKKTGLKQSTITNIVNELIESRLVIENGYVNSKVGRKAVKLSINTDTFFIISIRFTRHHILYGVFDLKINPIYVDKYSINLDESPHKILEELVFKLQSMQQKYSEHVFLGIGIAVPGPFVRNIKNVIYLEEYSKWDNTDIADYLSAKLNLPVTIEHDANVGALCEWWLDSEFLDKGSLLYIAVGQGIGSGFIVDGQIIRGSMGTFGEIGHSCIDIDGPKCKCGNYGCLELYSSTFSLLKNFVKAKESGKYKTEIKDNPNIDEFFEGLLKKDALALSIFNDTLRYLSVGIVNALNAYNPDMLVIGDEFSKAEELLIELILPMIKPRIFPIIYENTKIKVSKFKMDSAFIGSAIYFINNYL